MKDDNSCGADDISAEIFMASVANSNGEFGEAFRLLRQTLRKDARVTLTRRLARTLLIALFSLKPHRPEIGPALPTRSGSL